VEKPQLRFTKSNIAVSQFTIAVPRIKEGTDFIRCQTWGKQAENLCNYMDKGNKIAIDGRLETSTYEKQDGTKGYKTEVVAQNIEFLNSKNVNHATQSGTQTTNREQQNYDPYEEMNNQIELDITNGFLD